MGSLGLTVFVMAACLSVFATRFVTAALAAALAFFDWILMRGAIVAVCESRARECELLQ